jgi:hypothetical protein
MLFKNTFGSATASGSMDLQRQDLFWLQITLPPALAMNWIETVQFAVEKFPFPERSVEMIGVKYMQQTNFLIGGDTPTGAVEVPCRYAFAQPVAAALERWFWLVRNPRTGGVGLTSAVKTHGEFDWLVPNQSDEQKDIQNAPTTSSTALVPGLRYFLEGCLIKGFKFSDADMTTSGKVDCQFSLQIDRYYPMDVSAQGMTVQIAPSGFPSIPVFTP